MLELSSRGQVALPVDRYVITKILRKILCVAREQKS